MPLLSEFQRLEQHLGDLIIGQETLIRRLLISLLADGHLLVEGAPGLAKTRAIKDLAAGLEADFQRIQFTPDLLPADITGSEIFQPQTGQFSVQKGPVFHNLILADEINRAPAKVQSALLEAMAERQVSIGQISYPLPPLFLVMATQNPLEQEGTYPLPEAQLDRFLMQVQIDYPNAEQERRILALVRNEERSRQAGNNASAQAIEPLSQNTILAARREILEIYLDPALEEYLVQLIIATRTPERFDTKLAEWLEYGASPRASLALERCARAEAWLSGRDYVSAEDIQALVPDILRHRLILSYQAEAQGVSCAQVIERLLALVPVA